MEDYDKGLADATADYEWDKELGGRWLDLNLSDESIKNQLEKTTDYSDSYKEGYLQKVAELRAKREHDLENPAIATAPDLLLDGQKLLDYYLDDNFWDLAYRKMYEGDGYLATQVEKPRNERVERLNAGEMTEYEEFFEFVAKDPRISEVQGFTFGQLSVYTFVYTDPKGNEMTYKFDIYDFFEVVNYEISRWFINGLVENIEFPEE